MPMKDQIEKLAERMQASAEEAEKFRSHTVLVGNDPRNQDDDDFCWYWHGPEKYTLSDGYRTTPGRASWALYNGDAPRNSRVVHTCGLHHCVNPLHMVLDILPKRKK